MKLKACAKINLSLRILGQRADGYHNLESLMQSISLCDYVTVEPAASGIEVTCDDPSVPTGNKNIAYKAAEAFFRELKVERRAQNIGIHIEKHIPVAAGLAGGSADAAAVLFALNQISNIEYQISNIDLLSLAAQVGSDVPFCLVGGTCLIEGRGEKVTPQEPWPKTYFVLVKPDFEVSSKWAYEEFDNLHLNLPSEIKNDLEAVVVEKHPEITKIKEKLLALGCSETQMSGSGPTVFGIARHKPEALVIWGKMKSEYPRSFLVETVDKGIEIC